MDSEETAALYKRHESLKLSIPEEISIIGCGGTGFWTAVLSALSGTSKINLFDDDIVEIHNLSRLMLPYPESLGRRKTEATKDFIHTFRPDCDIITHDGIHTDSDLYSLLGNVIYDCNDDHTVQKKIHAYCKQGELRYISVGCNSEHITCMSSIDSLWGDGTGDRYIVTPMFFIPAMLAALAGLYHVIKGTSNVELLQTLKYMFYEQKNTNDFIREECNRCPLVDMCPGCQLHNTSEHEVCTCCPIDRTSI